jgi:P27 family predicted phage terminase small subunit
MSDRKSRPTEANHAWSATDPDPFEVAARQSRPSKAQQGRAAAAGSRRGARAAALLSGYAADEWWRVAPELHRLGLLSVLDVSPFAAYCVAYHRWRTAEEALASMAEKDALTGGLLVKRADGNAAQNPLVRVAANAAQAMVDFAGHFGMSPAARARISAGVWHEPPSGKFDGLLG